MTINSSTGQPTEVLFSSIFLLPLLSSCRYLPLVAVNLVCWLAWVCAFRIEYVGMALHCLNLHMMLHLRCTSISLCPHTQMLHLSRTNNQHGYWVCWMSTYGQKERFYVKNTHHTQRGATSRYTGKLATRVILCEKSENIITIRKTQKSWSRLDFRKWVRSIYVHWLRVLKRLPNSSSCSSRPQSVFVRACFLSTLYTQASCICPVPGIYHTWYVTRDTLRKEEKTNDKRESQARHGQKCCQYQHIIPPLCPEI